MHASSQRRGMRRAAAGKQQQQQQQQQVHARACKQAPSTFRELQARIQPFCITWASVHKRNLALNHACMLAGAASHRHELRPHLALAPPAPGRPNLVRRIFLGRRELAPVVARDGHRLEQEQLQPPCPGQARAAG